ncbi:proline/glycine betaine ABC transporter permease [Fodinicurvata sp. EGI_FJ10296]|uniref:ABC transporter permease n=1 Tax=Fodinicurvata sp. EGI_FJ10296 TaxID=3231908 RepID=UPI003455444F
MFDWEPEFRIPIGDVVSATVDWLRANASGLFDGIASFVGAVVDFVETILTTLPFWLTALIIIGIAWYRVGWRFGLFAVASMVVIVGIDLWPETMETLALILSATAVSLAIGIPVGIAAAKSDRLLAVIRPVLDLMQTLPPFVYLIPAAMLFGLGQVPGAIATIIFSMPPSVRLTNLGIRHVPKEMVEAGQSFGCTPRQLLFHVQIPNAMPSIMAGVNQTIMLALSMVVIASMIGAGGLGTEVLRGIQRLNVGLGFEGGLGVVILAVLLDRVTQTFGTGQRRATLKSRLMSVFTPGTAGRAGGNGRTEA